MADVDAKAMVLQAVDLVELIGKSVALKRRGKDFVGLCPFHSEKSPSFTVSPSKQLFFCYGCKAGGTAIDFVIKRDRVEFIDALKLLAESAGIELPRFGGKGGPDKSEKQALLAMQSAAGAFFAKVLADPAAGKVAREYLAERKIDGESIQRFNIGLAPDAWDGLLRGAVGKQFPPPQLATGGLVKAREGGNGSYDTFRNRLMFPIRDEGGRTIAFGGRVLPGSTDPAKYLNSPETPLFSKSRCIFGLDLARQKIVETRTAVIVEGYTDVVIAHQCGVSNVVSVLGTALTPQHAQILRRFADRIVLLFDADSAGDAAVEKAVGLLLTQPIEILIATMPQGMDPDEFLLEQGAEKFQELVAGGIDALSFKWKQLVRRLNSSGDDLTGQQRAVENYLGLLASARSSGRVDPIRWGAAIERVSRLTGLPADQLHRRFKAAPASRPKPAAAGGAESDASGDNPGSSGNVAKPAGPRSARDRAEEWILGVLLLEPQRWHKVQTALSPGDFLDPVCRAVAEEYWHHQRDEGEPVLNEFIAALSALPARGDDPESPGGEQLAAAAMQCQAEVSKLPDSEQTLADALAHIAQANRLSQERKLLGELRRTDTIGKSEEEEVALLRQLSQRVKERAAPAAVRPRAVDQSNS